MMSPLTMPKKKPTTDGRRARYEPLTAVELRDAASALKSLSGALVCAADDIGRLKLAGARIDGRNLLADGITDIRTVIKRIKTALFEAQLDQE